jgi:hypothetical protein
MAKVVKDGVVQTNIRLSESADKKLARLAKEADLTLGAFIEKMLDSYSEPSKPSNLASGVSDDWRSAVAELSGRLLALESRFEAIGAEGKGMYMPADKVAYVADLTACEPVQSVEAETVEPVAVETVEAGAGKKQKLTDDELDVLVSKYLAEANGVASDAIKAMQRDGCSCQRNRFFASKQRLQKG